MSRIGVLFGLIVLSIHGVASAQGAAGAPPAMPLAVDFAKVPVGTWAEYNATFGKIPPMKMRMALVAKGDDKTGHTIETVVEGGMAAMAGGKMAMQTMVAVGAGGDIKISKMVMQLGANDPMEMPVDAAQQFQKPDPKTFVKEEKVKVAAGSFKAKRYKHKTPQGDTFEFWVSDSVGPVGLVKMQGEQKSNPNVQGKVLVELAATGKDAKATITKKAKPFNQQALMQQMMGGAHGGAKKPAPAPVAPAAPKSK